MSVFAEEDFTLITDAAEGKHGAQQEILAIEGLRWLKLLLSKNQDYGSSAWMPPILAANIRPQTALLCRMSDKVRRIEKLSTAPEEALVAESLEDSIRDLGGYCLLYLACPSR